MKMDQKREKNFWDAIFDYTHVEAHAVANEREKVGRVWTNFKKWYWEKF